MNQDTYRSDPTKPFLDVFLSHASEDRAAVVSPLAKALIALGYSVWMSFIGHTTDSLWSVDLFRCESIVLRSYWVLVVMDQFTRRIIGLGVHYGPVDGPSLCRMFNAAIHGQGAPRHLSTDHDPLFEAHRWTANLRILEIVEIKTVPHAPISHPFVERLIGTMRREFLDHVLFWNARDLERKLADFQTYYNAARKRTR
jgi:putative transposase